MPFGGRRRHCDCPPAGQVLPELSGGVCPEGADGRLAPMPNPELLRRGAKQCSARSNAIQNHPVSASSSKHGSQVQVAMLQCIPEELAVTEVRALLVAHDKSVRGD